MTHGDKATYPRLGDVVGFCTKEQVLAVAEAVILIQRDNGNRKNRRRSRLKYTIDDRGLDWFRGELTTRLGQPLLAPRKFLFERMGDRMGWQLDADGTWQFTLAVLSGRLRDTEGQQLLTGLRAIAAVHEGQFRVTCNQNIVIAKVSEGQKSKVDEILVAHGLVGKDLLARQGSGVRLNALACVSFPTCSQAMAESERYLPTLLEKLEPVLDTLGLKDEPIVLRMTGCPNGCARPYNAEIGIVGKGPGKYNLHLGAAFEGTRLNRLYRENISESELISALVPLLSRYSKERQPAEHFGDFLLRATVIDRP